MKRSLLVFIFSFIFLYSLSIASVQAAGVTLPTDTGLSDAAIVDILKTLMNWLLGIFGFLAIIAFVISGIQYLVAAGDDDTISTAKRNMKYSIIGVIVALSGLVIIQAITSALTASLVIF